MPEAPVSGPVPPSPRTVNLGGVVNIGNAAAALRMGAPTQASPAPTDEMVITGLAGRVRSAFTAARTARMATVEPDMIEALLARRGEYTNEKKALITEHRQPGIYMMVAAGKMRQIEALLRDSLIGTGTEKPWTLEPTPSPEVPPEISERIVSQLEMEIQQAMMSGFPPSMEAARMRVRELRDEIYPQIIEWARAAAERMEHKMEDQLIEGGFNQALEEFISDLATFKTAFIAGPLVRTKPQLTWGQGGLMTVEMKPTLEWERVDPFDMFPAPWARNINDGPLIRRHRLTRDSLSSLIGTEGFDEKAIREALALYGDSGHREWLSADQQKNHAEGKISTAVTATGLIDTLQYWGSASGKMLRDLGMDALKVPDPAKEYQVEVWQINNIVIKAMLNADPLARRGIYADSFQPIPGSVWGNAPYDLMKDCQDMCNAAARALAFNMGISSGPQVAIISTRLPRGEDVTEMYPWKIWQFESDPMGSTAQPIQFFQPSSNANELMTVYERFSNLADEYTGIPKYMAGFNGGDGGAGRTASGISMMIGNASKIIKQVIGGIDTNILQPMLERLWYFNMRYSDDADLKGDIKCVARGAASLVTKEAARLRNNEFLQVALNSPVAQNIMGVEGVAEILRGTVKTLDHNPDKVVPPLPVLRQRMAQQQMQQMQMLAMQGGAPGAPGEQGAQAERPGPGRNLQDGSPATDNFGPQKGA